MQAFSNKDHKIPFFAQILKLLLSSALLYYCVSLVDFSKVTTLLAQVNLLYLLVSFVFTLLGTIVCKSFIVWRLLPNHQSFKFIEIIKINLVMRFYTMLLPKAIVAGLRWNKYRKFSDPAYALALLALEALVALNVAAMASVIFILLSGLNFIPFEVLITVLTVTILLSISIIIFFIYPDNWFVREIFKKVAKIKILSFIANLLEKWRQLSKRLGISEDNKIKYISFWAVISHLFFLIGAMVLFMAINVDIDFFVVAWIRSAVFILVSIPISLAGLGIREVGFIALFGLYGLSADVVMTYALLVLILQSIIGFFGMLIELKSFLINSSNQ